MSDRGLSDCFGARRRRVRVGRRLLSIGRSRGRRGVRGLRPSGRARAGATSRLTGTTSRGARKGWLPGDVGPVGIVVDGEQGETVADQVEGRDPLAAVIDPTVGEAVIEVPRERLVGASAGPACRPGAPDVVDCDRSTFELVGVEQVGGAQPRRTQPTSIRGRRRPGCRCSCRYRRVGSSGGRRRRSAGSGHGDIALRSGRRKRTG